MEITSREGWWQSLQQDNILIPPGHKKIFLRKFETPQNDHKSVLREI